MQLIQHIGLLLQLAVGLTIIDKPVRPRATSPLNDIGAIIATEKMHSHMPVLRPLTHKLPLIIGQMVKKGIANRLHYGRLRRSIGSTNRRRSPPEINSNLAVTFNIL